MGKVKELEKTVEEVKEKMCDHYCKYPEQYKRTVDGINDLVGTVCRNCPLNRL